MAPLPFLHKPSLAIDTTTDTESSSSGTPSTIRPEMSPTAMQKIVDRHTNWDTHYGSPTAPLQRHHTTKASILHDANMKDAITNDEYSRYISIVQVESIASIPSEKSCTIPVTMCVDEGTYVDFLRDLARLFGLRPGEPFTKAEIISKQDGLIKVQFQGYEKIPPSREELLVQELLASTNRLCGWGDKTEREDSH